ncbi:hypothetical protein DY000_02006392 [Brassica cretica]|uniref:Uncharacterized protein n=1 Tax=Brassica cretica TaxID=69181 RepID=A0ABQ7CFW0_BRACR|nr:hypothetical protein DY000_02006392 [Brassica cretica]
MSRNDRSNLQNEMGEEETTYRLSIVPRKATVDINGESGCKGFSVSEAILCATRYPSILSIKSPSESLVEDLRSGSGFVNTDLRRLRSGHHHHFTAPARGREKRERRRRIEGERARRLGFSASGNSLQSFASDF